MNLKTMVVNGLEAACGYLDVVLLHRWSPLAGVWRCPLARLSYDLDSRWGTGQWSRKDSNGAG